MTNCNATITTHCAMPVGHDPEIHISSVEPADLHTARAEIERLKMLTASRQYLWKSEIANTVIARQQVARAEAELDEAITALSSEKAGLVELNVRLDAVRMTIKSHGLKHAPECVSGACACGAWFDEQSALESEGE